LCSVTFVVQLPLNTTTMPKTKPHVKESDSAAPRAVVVREVPIELCQFIKFGGLADTGGGAKQLVSSGVVLLNGVVETQKRKKLAAGDRVTVEGQTIVVQVG
jgi:ribosome-associated protein